jgi:hypothetical protein
MTVAVALGAWENTGQPAYAVLATNDSASYFYPSSTDALETYNDEYIEKRSSRFSDENPKPDTPGGWIKFLHRIGPNDVHLARISPVESKKEAKKLARTWFAEAKKDPDLFALPNPERAAMLERVSEDFQAWAKEFPEAADALNDPDEEVDPDAAHALMIALYPPTRPDDPHAWMPREIGDEECMICDLEKTAEIHEGAAL